MYVIYTMYNMHVLFYIIVLYTQAKNSYSIIATCISNIHKMLAESIGKGLENYE